MGGDTWARQSEWDKQRCKCVAKRERATRQAPPSRVAFNRDHRCQLACGAPSSAPASAAGVGACLPSSIPPSTKHKSPWPEAPDVWVSAKRRLEEVPPAEPVPPCTRPAAPSIMSPDCCCFFSKARFRRRSAAPSRASLKRFCTSGSLHSSLPPVPSLPPGPY